MFLNTSFTLITRAARFAAVAAVLSAAAVPVAFTTGVDGVAFAQGNGGGGSRGGGGGRGGSDGNGDGNAARAQHPPCIVGANCPPKRPPVVRYTKEGCQVQICDVLDGQKVCWLERPYDLRKCESGERL